MTLRTSEVAAAAGVNRETLRYYERRGLLPEPSRSPGGHRLYPDNAVKMLQAIKAAQRLGFTLTEVVELLGPAGLHQRAEDKLAEIEAKIADLTETAASLRAAIDAGCDDLIVCAETQCCPVNLRA